MQRIVVAVAASALFLTTAAPAQVKVTVDRNLGAQATPLFKFEHVPSPTKEDAAATAKLDLVLGTRDSNGAALSALTDGALPSSSDDPAANFFFAAGTDGGRFRMDFGRVLPIAAVNSYSWHPSDRGPQVYNLFAADGTMSGFNPAPDENTDPATCGWKLIATVDTRPSRGDLGGQYGVSVTDAGGILGRYRYLLFDSVPSESDDPFGNTFFSEIDVIVRQ